MVIEYQMAFKEKVYKPSRFLKPLPMQKKCGGYAKLLAIKCNLHAGIEAGIGLVQNDLVER